MIAWASGKLYKPENISISAETSGERRTGRSATRHYAALGTGLAQNYLELRGRENPELYQTHEGREAWRI